MGAMKEAYLALQAEDGIPGGIIEIVALCQLTQTQCTITAIGPLGQGMVSEGASHTKHAPRVFHYFPILDGGRVTELYSWHGKFLRAHYALSGSELLSPDAIPWTKEHCGMWCGGMQGWSNYNTGTAGKTSHVSAGPRETDTGPL